MKVLYYILFSILLFSCNSKIEEVPPFKLQSNDIIFQLENNEINAGEEVKASGKILIDIPHEVKFDLLVSHALYSEVFTCKTNNGLFQFVIPAYSNKIAGEVNLYVLFEGKLIGKDKYFIKPLEGLNKIQIFNGPKELFAEDEDASMIVAIPHDPFGNPLLPPSTVNFRSNFEGKLKEESNAEIKHLTAYKITKSKSKQGKYIIGVNSSEANAQEQELIIGANMPSSFTIELLSFYPFADSRQNIHIKTDVIKDNLGNIVADGTMINFIIKQNEELYGVYQSYTIGGIANIYIQNPNNATVWQITGGLYDNIISNEITLNFSKNINDFKLHWNHDKKILNVGPVIGDLGQFVPDGSEVRISSINHGLEDFVYLENGIINYKLNFEWIAKDPKQLEVLIGGLQKMISIEE